MLKKELKEQVNLTTGMDVMIDEEGKEKEIAKQILASK